MCFVRLLPSELGSAAFPLDELRPSLRPLHLQRDQKVRANRAASVLCTWYCLLFYCIETTPHNKSLGIVTSVRPSLLCTERSTEAASGVSRRAEWKFPA